MLILSRVCAEFRDQNGKSLFTVTPEKRLTFVEAPEAIQEDPLFGLLVAEGSLEAAQTAQRRKALENDPAKDTEASGRRRAPKQA